MRPYDGTMISIVIPIYNEEKILEKNIKNIISGIRQYEIPFEIVLVENGSKDRTTEIGKKLAKEDSRVKFLTLGINSNYGAALKHGMLNSKGEIILNFDIDFYDIEFTRVAYALLPFKYDIIVASKNSRLSIDKRSTYRHWISRIYKYVLFIFFGLKVSDTHGIKAWRNDTFLRKLISESKHTMEIFDTELIIKSQDAGRKLLEIPIEIVETRKSVKSILPRALRGFMQIMKLWVEIRVNRHLRKINNKIIKKELFYNSIATDWLEFMNKYEVEKRLKLVNNLLSEIDIRNKSLLDAGCGLGLFSELAEKLGADVTSLDVGEELMKEVAKRSNSKRVIGTLSSLPFPNNYFDIVLSTEVLEHMDDPKLGISEIVRVTKPGGRIIITTPNKTWKIAVYIANLLKVRQYQGNENWLYWYELRNELESHDVEIYKKFGFNLFPIFKKPFYKLLDIFDSFGIILNPIMVNNAIAGVKKKLTSSDKN